MNVGIVDCGGANLKSIKYALRRINVDSEVSSSIDILKTKDAFILPGVGSACLLYTSPSPRDKRQSRMPSSA